MQNFVKTTTIRRRSFGRPYMLLHEPLIVEYFIEMLRSLYVIEVESVIALLTRRRKRRIGEYLSLFIIAGRCGYVHQ